MRVNQARYKPQDEARSDRSWEGRWEHWIGAHFTWGAALVLIAAFLVRLKAAYGTFLNPDEALHYLLANQSSWALAYRASLTNAHPPLLTFVLHFWRHVGGSEIVLRLPSVIAGTAFCWVFFKWATRLFGRATGFIGLLLVSFLPPMIELATEVRQYALLLFFLASVAYWLERALKNESAGMMLASATFLCLAMLTHYSAILFAAAMGIYGLLRVIGHRPATKVLIAWAFGQASVLMVFAFLYATHISKLKGDYASGTINGWLANSFFRSGHDNPFLFVIARSGGVFQYAFGQLAVGDVGFVAFLAAIVLLKTDSIKTTVDAWHLRTLLAVPFVIGAAAALARLYPYGGTRHSAFLLMFAVAGVSYFLAWLVKDRIGRGILVAVLIVSVCTAFGKPHRPYMLRGDQSRAQMTGAMQYIHAQVPPSDVILVDYQTRLLLAHYLCPETPMSFLSSGVGLGEFPCGGYRIVAAGTETYTFTTEDFLKWWDELQHMYPPAARRPIWVIQAGWEINLCGAFSGRVPQLRELQSQSFGKNITICKLARNDSATDLRPDWSRDSVEPALK